MEKLKNVFLNDRVILSLIALNLLLIYIGDFLPESLSLRYADATFTILFLLEAILKIGDSGWKQYWSDGWNKFDFIIVVIALPSLCNLFMEESIPTNTIFVLRVLRTFKTFMLFRYVPDISKILNGLKHAVRSSLVVCLAFVVFVIVCSVITSTLFAKHAPQFFGNPLLSLYNTFRVFTIEGWYEMPDTIASNGGTTMGIFARFYFSVLLFVGGIIGMSLINSIFVDAMVADNNDDVVKKLEEIERLLKEKGER